MARAIETITRPQRWDSPFDPEMTAADVDGLMANEVIAAIEAELFPDHTPLGDILLFDTRIVDFAPGDFVVRENDYGNSAFLILAGTLRVVLSPSLPEQLLGRQTLARKGWWETLSQLWTNSWRPELRDVDRYEEQQLRGAGRPASAHVVIQDIPAILDEHRTAVLGANDFFGELAALGRIPRTATVFAETPARVLEIRWQGLRELHRFDPGWRRQLDKTYRENALLAALREAPMFSHLDAADLRKVSDSVLFETHGSFDWHTTYKRLREQGKESEHGTVIAREGDYPDGLLYVRAGFARISKAMGNGERTLNYLGAGDFHGMDELYAAWQGKSGDAGALDTSLTALGYVDLLRIPRQALEEFVFPTYRAPAQTMSALAGRDVGEDALLEWAVDQRFINGTQAMLIDLDACVRCDDCVRACASTHGGNPRFLRHGSIADHWMVANACMHCADPVCLIGCPTGAIHRTIEGGMVVINDDTCIGCGTCAASCPYDNIRLVDIRNKAGDLVQDTATHLPIQKATKCDLCVGNMGGPACVRACPHDALRRVEFHGSDPFAGSAS
jgi:Fe-S-cluster-containing dehydrogenase component/CRP-like cAMP-binding protein